jgi:transposase
LKKYSTLVQQNTGTSKLDEIKKLKERIEELAFVKNFQQDFIAGIEITMELIYQKSRYPK